MSSPTLPRERTDEAQHRTSRLLGRRTAWLVALRPAPGRDRADRGLGPRGPGTHQPGQPARGLRQHPGTALRDALPEEDASVAVVLWTSDDGELAQATVADLGRQAAQRSAPCPPARTGPLTVAEDGTAAIAVVPVESTSRHRERRPGRPSCATRSPPTAPTASQPGHRTGRGRGRPGRGLRRRRHHGCCSSPPRVVALLLLITYRSPVLWLIPLTVVGVADRLAAVLATQVLARARRGLGRVDRRHPLGAGLRRRHRLRAAADLALPRRAARPTRPRTRRWRRA